MRRVVYEVKKVKRKRNDHGWTKEKRHLALRLINNASVLSDAVNTFKIFLEKNPDFEVKDAVAKIDSVIEDLKVDFKKNYMF